MNKHVVVPLVMAGGSGTRLWPLSRELYPKQFLALAGEQTLFQQAVLRLALLGDEDIEMHPGCTVGNEEHRFLLVEQLREVGQARCTVLLEPAPRNTAPALTLATLYAVDSAGGDPILVVTPADHAIGDTAGFTHTLRTAVRAACEGGIVLVGVTPDRPETGYGYIRCEGREGQVRRVAAFVEKPNVAAATRYLEQGDHYWNCGMFVLRASVWLKAMAAFQPEMAAATSRAWETRSTDRGFIRPGKEQFQAIPPESIDRAVIEKCRASSDTEFPIHMVKLASDWSDLGAWDAVWQSRPKDEQGNVAQGDAMIQDSRDTLVYATSRLVSAVGLDHVIVVETPDAVLVADRSSSQEVRRVVEHLGKFHRGEGSVHRLVHRPWGWYDCIDCGPRFQVKRILVKPKSRLSLQMHHHRAEHWVVVSGTAEVTCGDRKLLITENQSTYIPLGEIHCLANPGTIPLEIIEVQSGSYLGEDDILRFEDSYGRT